VLYGSSVQQNAAKAGLIALMVLGALMLWIGSPVLWLWIGSQVTESQQAGLGPYMLVGTGILVSTVLVALFLARINRLYEKVSGHQTTVTFRLAWLRSMRDERAQATQITVLDLILVSTAVAAIITATLWFFLLAGSPIG
jgi:hypothetical protein